MYLFVSIFVFVKRYIYVCVCVYNVVDIYNIVLSSFYIYICKEKKYLYLPFPEHSTNCLCELSAIGDAAHA